MTAKPHFAAVDWIQKKPSLPCRFHTAGVHVHELFLDGVLDKLKSQKEIEEERTDHCPVT